MAASGNRRRSGPCPLCGALVPIPEFLSGMWSGAKPNGMPAGGGVFETTCACGAALIAYNDVYDDTGGVRHIPADERPELVWAVNHPRR